MVYGETLSNPQLRLMDIPAVAAAAGHVRARVVVDNTFATPMCTRPLDLGADVVVESATKFLAGHSDVIAGAVTTTPDARTIRTPVQSSTGSWRERDRTAPC